MLEPVLDPKALSLFSAQCSWLAARMAITLNVPAAVERMVLFAKENAVGDLMILWCASCHVRLLVRAARQRC